MEFLNIFFTPDFYSATFRLATPLMLAALGGVISERSGVLNMALEGQILMGAFFGYLGSYLFQNVWLGVLTAMLGSLFLAALHAFMSIKVKVNQVVSAVGLNTLALGITSTLFRFLFGTDSQMASCPGMMNLDISVLSDLPFVGPVLFSQHPLTYIAVALLILLNLFLFRTSRGLELRAAGENPQALDVAGVDVIRIRWLAVLATGLFCGLAGASLTLTGPMITSPPAGALSPMPRWSLASGRLWALRWRPSSLARATHCSCGCRRSLTFPIIST